MNDIADVSFTLDVTKLESITPGLFGWGNMLGLNRDRVLEMVCGLSETLHKPNYEEEPDCFERDILLDVIGYYIEDTGVAPDPVALRSFEDAVIHAATHIRNIAPVVILETDVLCSSPSGSITVIGIRGFARVSDYVV